jgi:hypothetical protein
MYTNNKEQISLEEAYRLVHEEKKDDKVKKKENPCCDSCEDDEPCECEESEKEVKKESIDVPPSFEDAVDASKVIVHQGDDAESELQKFLPLIFSAAAREAGFDELQADRISRSLMGAVNISEVESKISDLHAEKEKLTSEAKYSMEAQVKLNSVIDKILKQGTLEALDVLYYDTSKSVPPSKVVKALESEISKRIESRK